MADWQRHLRLNPEWKRAQENEIPVQQLAKVVAERLKALTPFNDDDLDDERDNIADEFRDVAENDDAGTSDFDYVMRRLYDWGDTKLDNAWPGKKVCWIDTMSPA